MNYIIERYTTASKKIRYYNLTDFISRLNEIGEEIISIKSCIPPITDTYYWYNVRYKIQY